MGESKAIEPQWSNLKTLGKGEREFTANGKEYRISSSISFERWRDMQHMQAELGAGFSILGLVERLKEQRGALNKLNFVEASIINNDLLLGVAAVDNNRWPTALRMCALFVNYKGENVNTIDETLILEKINDWRLEGYDFMGFFHLAFSSVPGFLNAYSIASQIISGKEEPLSDSTYTNEAKT